MGNRSIENQVEKKGSANAKSAECRRCGRSVLESGEHYPFCSDRCRMADLNSWFDGDYKVSREIKDSDIETVD
ncbi:MAG: DNA gyrase inhibitor YacG [Phycisphaerales bacterium JB065]